ncbi:hypothetical protein FOL47_001779 [Perkinsus chesapeaki]|uniref:Uncharacterized protein n=1 Tax=Perkinsus chesapeaki TaxID=330153 RepID=A0A7J6MI97_PERCH|nr:hypothetical protein FOL47_001779 [Perkinsus chesapeaki]
MKSHLCPLIASIIVASACSVDCYREYRDSDRFDPSIEDGKQKCRDKIGLPCYVEFRSKVESVVAYVSVYLNYSLEPQVERAIKARTKDPTRPATFDYIDGLEVARGYNFDGEARVLVIHAIFKGLTTGNALALVVCVNHSDEAAISLYTRARFQKIEEEKDMLYLAHYYYRS